MMRSRGQFLSVVVARNGAIGAEGMTGMFGAADVTDLASNRGRAKHARESER
jgi:hypothetical protein